MLGGQPFAFLFNCTPVGRTSDSLTFPLKRLISRWDGMGLIDLAVKSCQTHRGLPVGFLLLRYSVLCTNVWVLIFALFSFYILIEDAWISRGGGGSCKPNILLNIWTKGEVGGPWNRFKPSSKNIFTDRSRAVLPLWIFLLFMFRVCHVFMSVHYCLVVICWEMADFLALVCDVLLCFVTFPCGTVGQVWYLFMSDLDICHLSYFL